eukprot:2711806-Rhodomonas_salina.1
MLGQFQDILMVTLATVIATHPNESMALDACDFIPDYPGDPTGSAAFSIKKRKNDQRGNGLLQRVAKARSGPTEGPSPQDQAPAPPHQPSAETRMLQGLITSYSMPGLRQTLQAHQPRNGPLFSPEIPSSSYPRYLPACRQERYWPHRKKLQVRSHHGRHLSRTLRDSHLPPDSVDTA